MTDAAPCSRCASAFDENEEFCPRCGLARDPRQAMLPTAAALERDL